MPSPNFGWLTSAPSFSGGASSAAWPTLREAPSEAGLGDTLQSWISQGENLPISAEQLQQVFSADTLNSLAEKAGIDPAQAGEWLSANLPEWVNQLTPNGSLSDLGGVFEQGVSAVKDFFSKF